MTQIQNLTIIRCVTYETSARGAGSRHLVGWVETHIYYSYVLSHTIAKNARSHHLVGIKEDHNVNSNTRILVENHDKYLAKDQDKYHCK